MDQTLKAEKVILVLAEEEFPDRALPAEYHSLQKRGLEILWAKKNSRSFKKLIPVAEAFPGMDVITADDDILYPPTMVQQLVDNSSSTTQSIVGHRGWSLTTVNSRLLPYSLYVRAGASSAGPRILLTSGAGILFPERLLRSRALRNLELAQKLCPTADDIWFWGVSVMEGWTPRCLGNHKIEPAEAQSKTPQLYQVNVMQGQNDLQLAEVINYFGLQGKLCLKS